MPATCPQCNSPNASNARFCQKCGQSMAAPQEHGKTMTAPAAASTPINLSTIIASAQTVLGNGVTSSPAVNTDVEQREHTVCVMDVSGSMAGRYDAQYDKLTAAKRSFSSMLAQKASIDPDDEVGIVQFSDDARAMSPILPLRTCKQALLRTLQSLTIDGGTDINEGLKGARDLFDWRYTDVVRRIVLLTDGHGGNPIHTAEELKSNGVIIDVIGVGEDPGEVDEKLLKKVASVIQGETRYRFIKDGQTLVSHMTVLGGKTAIS